MLEFGESVIHATYWRIWYLHLSLATYLFQYRACSLRKLNHHSYGWVGQRIRKLYSSIEELRYTIERANAFWTYRIRLSARWMWTHHTKSVSSFLDTENVQVLPWPRKSLDLNPIKHIWAILKRRLRELSTYPATKDELFQKLSEVWNNLPANYFKKLVASMSSRCIAISNVRRDACKYWQCHRVKLNWLRFFKQSMMWCRVQNSVPTVLGVLTLSQPLLKPTSH